MKMRNLKIVAALLGVLAAAPAIAQTSPNLTKGQVLTAGQWNALFASKQDTLGYTPLNTAGGSMTGRLVTAAPGSTIAGFNLTPGSAPASPVDGDLWATTTGLFARINGASINLLSGGATYDAIAPIVLTQPAGVVTYSCPTCGVTGSPLSQFASTTSAQLAGIISNETGTGVLVFGTGPTLTGVTITTSFTATGLVGLGNLANQATNTILANITAGSAAPTALAVASCTGSSNALQWVTNTGLSCAAIVAAAGSVAVGTTTITSGTTTRILYDNAGVLGEYTISGSGTVVAMATSPSFTTPALGVATGTSLALGGCTISTNALCATGTAAISSTLTSAAHAITSASASALAVGVNGATNPALKVDASTASSATGLQIKSAAAASGLALSVITSGTNENLAIDAAGSGTITLGGTSTGAIVHTRASTFSAAITYGGVALSNAVTGTGNMVLSAGPTFTGSVTLPTITGNLALSSGTLTITSSSASAFSVGPNGATNPVLAIDASIGAQVVGLKITGAVTAGAVALVATDSGANAGLTINAKGTGAIGIGSVSTGAVTITPNITHSGTTTMSAAITYGGVTLANSVTGTGSMVLASSPSIASLTVTTAFTATGLVTYANMATAAIATTANYYAAAASVLVPASIIYPSETTTTFGATTTFDFSTFINTAVTLTANTTTQTLSNVQAGKAGSISFIQGGAGSFTTVWNSIFKFAAGTAPTLSTAVGAIDILFYSCRSATNCPASLVKDVK